MSLRPSLSLSLPSAPRSTSSATTSADSLLSPRGSFIRSRAESMAAIVEDGSTDGLEMKDLSIRTTRSRTGTGGSISIELGLGKSGVKKEKPIDIQKPKGRLLHTVNTVLDSIPYAIIMLVLTAYVLFVNDIVTLCVPPKSDSLDQGIAAGHFIVLLIFLAELIVTSLAKPHEYFLRFYFWLDLLAIISIIPDCLVLFGVNTEVDLSTLTLVRIGRAARASSKMARLARSIKLYQTVQERKKLLAEQRKRASNANANANANMPPSGPGNDDPSESMTSTSQVEVESDVKPSALGIALTNKTTNKVVAIVLLLVLFSQFVTVDVILRTGDTTAQEAQAGLEALEAAYPSLNGTSAFTEMISAYRNTFSNDGLIFLKIDRQKIYKRQPEYDDLRPKYIIKYKTDSERTEAWIDVTEIEQLRAGLSIVFTVFVILVLVLGNILVVRDATVLVITPFEKMLAMIGSLATRLAQFSSGSHDDGTNADDTLNDATSDSDLDGDDDDATAAAVIGANGAEGAVAGTSEEELREAREALGMLSNIGNTLKKTKQENKELKMRLADAEAERARLRARLRVLRRRVDRAGPGAAGVAQDLVDINLDAVDNATTDKRKSMFGLRPLDVVGTLTFGTSKPRIMEKDSRTIKFEHRNAPAAAAAAVTTVSPSSSSAAANSDYPVIASATCERLVERLAYDDYLDAVYVQQFLLTYRAIMSPHELLDRLIARYCITPPDTLLEATADAAASTNPGEGRENPAEVDLVAEWRTLKQKPIKKRVLSILAVWVKQFPFDFEDDDNPAGTNVLFERVNEFVTTVVSRIDGRALKKDTKKLRTILKQMRKELEQRRAERLRMLAEATAQAATPPALADSAAAAADPPDARAVIDAIAPKMEGVVEKLLAVDLVVIAQHLCLIEQDLYTLISPHEFFGLAWTKKGAEQKCPNLLRFINNFNRTSGWITAAVVCTPKLKTRKTLVKRFILLGKELLKLHNFNGAMEVLSGLSNAAVSRLKATWELINKNKDLTAAWEELQSTLASTGSYKKYREALRSTRGPAIPYMGVYLSDLTFIEEGNVDTVVDTSATPPIELINFDKRRQIANVLMEVLFFMRARYEGTFAVQPDVRDLLVSIEPLDDKRAYDLSLLVEPRQPSK